VTAVDDSHLRLLERIWWRDPPAGRLLAPLGWLGGRFASLRNYGYRTGLLRRYRLPVPVIVIGNIVVGGTGKTPLTIWLVELLRNRGWTPGVVSRGYGGSSRHWPRAVTAASDPAEVGDEPVVIAARTAVPVYVAPDRVAAARALLESHPCDVILCDDGLQHLRLARQIEIAVVDGGRRHGNGRCLPAGPLREPPSRLESVDIVICHDGRPRAGERTMRSWIDTAVHVESGQERALESFLGQRVVVLAAVGNPDRLRRQIGALLPAAPIVARSDHYRWRRADLDAIDADAVLMTEKDAVKCRRFGDDRIWYIPLRVEIDPAVGERVLELLSGKSPAAVAGAPGADARP
jgi:tetraacyldisaccharide 4'-kinase